MPEVREIGRDGAEEGVIYEIGAFAHEREAPQTAARPGRQSGEHLGERGAERRVRHHDAQLVQQRHAP